MSEKMYLVGSLCTKHKVDFLNKNYEIDMSWAEDMIGAMPVFKTREAAFNYANGQSPIYEIEEKTAS